MKRPYSPDELNRLEQAGYNTSNYKGELVEFPDAESQSSVSGSVARGLAAEAIPATAGAAGVWVTLTQLWGTWRTVNAADEVGLIDLWLDR